MRKPEKHKKNLVLTWDEEDSFPTHSRSAHLLGPGVKVTKPVAVKGRSGNATPPKADALAMREPARPARITIRQPQPASWDHLRKLERLPNLRAPYQYKAHR